MTLFQFFLVLLAHDKAILLHKINEGSKKEVLLKTHIGNHHENNHGLDFELSYLKYTSSDDKNKCSDNNIDDKTLIDKDNLTIDKSIINICMLCISVEKWFILFNLTSHNFN